ncbi:enoyl-CoA hydratase/isomerase family protein [Sphingobium phenoxybenzoativorans]|uniref:enoyl-CoA hydratase/isomerase family protein n=1 Tax=Sphingobium phenoxybenzoativorans TaxID=1592790 RepID=UPI0008722660|nr:enoyl-CoA hydratase/isomerase family protein [Sphingobium phenoxybenzoativorans]
MGRISIERGVRGDCHLIIDNPHRRNAMNLSMIESLEKHFVDFALDSDCRMIIIRGADGNFCSGRDLSDFQGADVLDDDAVRADYAILCRLMLAIEAFPKPLVSIIQGHAIGLGVAIAAGSDVVIAATDAAFSFPEVRFGIAPTLSAAMLLRNVGPKKALYALLTGSRFDGQEAERIGLVSRAVAPEEFDSTVGALIDGLLLADPEACAHLKKLVQAVDTATLPQALDAAMEWAVKSVRSEGAAEGRKARQEKRPPAWVLPGSS